jgi:hypothetical protein
MNDVAEITFKGKRYLVKSGGVVRVYCESKTAWRSGWRTATSAKVIADVLRAYAKTREQVPA